jgi:hypothetical protein
MLSHSSARDMVDELAKWMLSIDAGYRLLEKARFKISSIELLQNQINIHLESIILVSTLNFQSQCPTIPVGLSTFSAQC